MSFKSFAFALFLASSEAVSLREQTLSQTENHHHGNLAQLTDGAVNRRLRNFTWDDLAQRKDSEPANRRGADLLSQLKQKNVERLV
jgi:hypothetical protein